MIPLKDNYLLYCELLQPPRPKDGCPRQNGRFKLAEKNKYLYCRNGQGTVHTCLEAQIFDGLMGNCAHPDTVVRGKAECSEEVRYGFVCPLGFKHNEKFRFPGDCRAYFLCAQYTFTPSLRQCDFGLVFNGEYCTEPKKVPGCEKYYDKEE